MKGNIISWENAEFEKENVEEITMSLSNICVPVSPGHVVFPMRRDFQSHVGLCSKMRGITTTVQDQAMNDKLMDEVEQWTSCGDPLDRM